VCQNHATNLSPHTKAKVRLSYFRKINVCAVAKFVLRMCIFIIWRMTSTKYTILDLKSFQY